MLEGQVRNCSRRSGTAISFANALRDFQLGGKQGTARGRRPCFVRVVGRVNLDPECGLPAGFQSLAGIIVDNDCDGPLESATGELDCSEISMFPALRVSGLVRDWGVLIGKCWLRSQKLPAELGARASLASSQHRTSWNTLKNLGIMYDPSPAPVTAGAAPAESQPDASLDDATPQQTSRHVQ